MSMNIVVGYDGSDCAHEAVVFAITLAERLDGELSVVVGCAPKGIPFDLAGTIATHRHELEAASAEGLKPVEEVAAGAAIPVSTHVVYQHPAAAILEVAEEVEGDLIVVGLHGEGAFSEGVFGSTVHRLLAHSGIPVVVVPAA